MKYALAYCSGGLLGLITSGAPKTITYADGNTGISWTGLQVCGGSIAGRGGHAGQTFTRTPGTPWSSSRPEIIAQLSEEEGARLESHLRSLAPA
jgi:hypothetical protein